MKNIFRSSFLVLCCVLYINANGQNESATVDYDQDETSVLADSPAVSNATIDTKAKGITMDDVAIYVKLADLKNACTKVIKIVNSIDSSRICEGIISGFLSSLGYPDFKAFDNNYGITCFFCDNTDPIILARMSQDNKSAIDEFIKKFEIKTKIVNGWTFFSTSNSAFDSILDPAGLIAIANAAERNDLELVIPKANKCIYELIDSQFIALCLLQMQKSSNGNNATLNQSSLELLHSIIDEYINTIETLRLSLDITDASIITAMTVDFKPGTSLAKFFDSKNFTNSIPGWANFMDYDSISSIARYNLPLTIDYAKDILIQLGVCNPIIEQDQLSKITSIFKSSCDGTFVSTAGLDEACAILINMINGISRSGDIIDQDVVEKLRASVPKITCFSWNGSKDEFFTAYKFIMEKIYIQTPKKILSLTFGEDTANYNSSFNEVGDYKGVTICESKVFITDHNEKSNAAKTIDISHNYVALVDTDTGISDLGLSNTPRNIAVIGDTQECVKILIETIKDKKAALKPLLTCIGTFNIGDMSITKIDVKSLLESIITISKSSLKPNYDVTKPINIRTIASGGSMNWSVEIHKQTITELISLVISAIVQNKTAELFNTSPSPNPDPKSEEINPKNKKKLNKIDSSHKKKNPLTKKSHKNKLHPEPQAFENQDDSSNNGEKFIIPVKTPLLYKTNSRLHA